MFDFIFPEVRERSLRVTQGAGGRVESLRVGYCWKVSKSRKNPFDRIESCRENGKTGYWDANAVGEGRLKLNEIKRGEGPVVSFLYLSPASIHSKTEQP